MIAIIPARGGSKGLPGKNIKMLCGKPLIAYTIESAKKAKCINRVIVTTDSEEIARVAKEYGAEVPFLRPKELATDTATASDVYIHCIDFLRSKGNYEIANFMVLLPTAPLRTENEIDEAYHLFAEKKATTLLSVCEAEIPPSWYLKKDEYSIIENAGFIGKDIPVSNRQNSKKYYIPNGAIYILNFDLLLERKTYYCNNTIGYVMAREASIDIDELIDFEFAELLIEKKLSKNSLLIKKY